MRIAPPEKVLTLLWCLPDGTWVGVCVSATKLVEVGSVCVGGIEVVYSKYMHMHRWYKVYEKHTSAKHVLNRQYRSSTLPRDDVSHIKGSTQYIEYIGVNILYAMHSICRYLIFIESVKFSMYLEDRHIDSLHRAYEKSKSLLARSTQMLQNWMQAYRNLQMFLSKMVYPCSWMVSQSIMAINLDA